MQLINVARVANIIKDIQYIDFWNTPESSFTAAYDLLYKGIKFDVVVQMPDGNMLAGYDPGPDPDEPLPPDPDEPDQPDLGTNVNLVILFVVDQQHRDLFHDLAKNIYLNWINRREEIYHMINPTQEGYGMQAEFKSNIWSFRLEFN